MSRMRKPFTLAPVEPEPTAEPQEAPAAPPPPPKDPCPGFEQFMLLQVVNPESNYFGVIFTIGAASETELHGYYIMPGKAKHFITVPLSDCKAVGVAEVKSKNPTSPEWNKMHE